MNTHNGINEWAWIQLNKNEVNDIKPIIERDDQESSQWFDQITENKTNCLRVDCDERGNKVIKGSLIYRRSFEKEHDVNIFHFYVTKEKWVTIDLEMGALQHLRTDKVIQQIKQAENAVDGFLFFLGELMSEMLVEIDQFEEALKNLIWSIRKRNETSILELVYLRRHELLVWKSLLIPINELKMAIDELNLHEEGKSESFKMTCKRIDRALTLINEYEHEIDSIINLEEVISSHRGNEITKTLTVITTVFTPIMAYGALWGMNFKYMPEIDWRLGYPLAIILIIISTILLYGYLKIKGWTGDLLKGKKKGSFFK